MVLKLLSLSTKELETAILQRIIVRIKLGQNLTDISGSQKRKRKYDEVKKYLNIKQNERNNVQKIYIWDLRNDVSDFHV